MSLIAWYKLDKLNGSGLVPDCSGNEHDGTWTDVSFGQWDGRQAGSFNGSTSIINGNSEFIGASPITVCCWIFLNGWGEGGAYGLGRIVDNGKFVFNVTEGTPTIPYASLGFSSNVSTHYIYSAAYAIGLGAWYHVAVTRTAAGVANFYVNGVLSGTANQNSGSPAGGTSNVLIGDNVARTRAFNGLMDDIRIYNEPLFAEKIKAIYRDRKGRPYPWQPHIVEPIVEEVVCYGH